MRVSRHHSAAVPSSARLSQVSSLSCRLLVFCFLQISHAEFVDKSHVVAPELDAVRASRRESQGCSCACVRADKLNVARLREELNKR